MEDTLSKYNCACGTTGAENFYKSAQYQCKACWNKRTIQSASDKIKALKLKQGGKCVRCGYDKYLGALQFHHIDPTVKEFSPGDRWGLSASVIQAELDKCQLLCANCHAEVHHEMRG